jgi:hypothetical protein
MFLYIDDALARRKATSVGIPTFGTLALILAAQADGRILESDTDQAIRVLMAEFVVDLPIGVADILRQAEVDGWSASAGAAPLTRSRFWTDEACFVAWKAIADGAAGAGADQLVRWVQAALEGALRASRMEHRLKAVARIVAAALASGYQVGLLKLGARLPEMLWTAGALGQSPGIRDRLQTELEANVGDEQARWIAADFPPVG